MFGLTKQRTTRRFANAALFPIPPPRCISDSSRFRLLSVAAGTGLDKTHFVFPASIRRSCCCCCRCEKIHPHSEALPYEDPVIEAERHDVKWLFSSRRRRRRRKLEEVRCSFSRPRLCVASRRRRRRRRRGETLMLYRLQEKNTSYLTVKGFQDVDLGHLLGMGILFCPAKFTTFCRSFLKETKKLNRTHGLRRRGLTTRSASYQFATAHSP